MKFPRKDGYCAATSEVLRYRMYDNSLDEAQPYDHTKSDTTTQAAMQ